MSVLQKVFLHTPAHSTAVVEEYERQHREEGEQLDFKAIPWKKGETLKTPSLEAAKDVAAFANHLGGDIIIGINDKSDCADGWNPIPNADIPATISNIRDWLIKHIRPQEVAQIVDIEPVSAPKPDSSVLVVSIPPFPQLVGVEDRETDKLTFQFPIRTGRRTRWLTFDEIMTRTFTSTRGTYIKLKALADSIGAPTYISFTSPVLVVAGDEQKDLLKPGRIHCEIVELTPDVIKVQMNGSENPIRGRVWNPNGGVAGLQTVRVEARHKLTIPLEFVRAVWKDRKASELEHMSIALAANIVWNGDYWSIVTGALSH
jgi:hypothetical protein